jgi:hypothetical protein
VSRRPPREARFLGLWTAGWLALFLLVGLLVAGDVRVQWPVLAVPVLWALVALRPRRRRAGVPEDDDEPGFWDQDPGHGTEHLPPGDRWSRGEQVPPTRETQVLPPLPPRPEDRRYG